MENTLENQNIKYPNIKIQLVGTNGNAFAIIGKVMKALREAGIPQTEISEFTKEATSGDYDHLLRTCMNWVDVS